MREAFGPGDQPGVMSVLEISRSAPNSRRAIRVVNSVLRASPRTMRRRLDRLTNCR